ncbi:MAG: PEGA domain-containing protein [Acidobacteriota bacterium]
MKLRSHIRILFFLAGSCAFAIACTSPAPTNSNQGNGNANRAQSNAPQTNSSADKPTQQPDQTTTGTIEISSVPTGARIVLVPTDAEPRPKGSTPSTITGLEPGKYTVDLEKAGYKSFQKDVEVKAGRAVKISATLKKQ